MRTVKRLMCVLLTAAMIASFGAAAAETAAFSDGVFKDNGSFIQDYIPLQDSLLVCCAAMEKLSEASGFQAKLGGKDVPVTAAVTAEGEAVTYYCLVDVSGSVEDVQLICAKQMLQAICDGLGAEDRMVIATVGNERRASGYLSDRRLIAAQIDAISATNEDTNLYRAVTDSLEELETGREATVRKCLVIFSDGEDDAAAEVARTRQEAERKIAETRIPVYCMFPPSENREAAKTLASMARQSFGGEAYYLADRQLTEAQIGQAIAEDMKGDIILTLDLSGLEADRDELLLTVLYTLSGGASYGDSIDIISSNLRLTPPTPEPTPDAPPEETAAPAEDGAGDGKGMPEWLIPAAALVCLLIAAAIVLLLAGRKKRRNAPSAPDGADSPGAGTQGGENLFPGGAGEEAAPGRPVRFTKIGSGNLEIEIRLEEGKPTTLGRNRKADVIFNEKDPRLSGLHFGLMLQGKQLQVWDAGSTNGTSVNGVPLTGNTITIRSGETLGVGSYRYRVRF